MNAAFFKIVFTAFYKKRKSLDCRIFFRAGGEVISGDRLIQNAMLESSLDFYV
jgi:hypothetical protein